MKICGENCKPTFHERSSGDFKSRLKQIFYSETFNDIFFRGSSILKPFNLAF